MAYDREPYRVGVIQDFGLESQPFTDMNDALKFALACGHRDGILDRPIEVEFRAVEGLGYAQWSSVRSLWRELVFERDCMAVIGPHFSHSVAQLKHEVDVARVPMLTMAAAGDGASEWQFTLPNGTHSDEAVILVDHLHREGVESVALLADEGMGDELITYFRARAARVGLRIAGVEVTGAPAEPGAIQIALSRLRDSGAEALAYVGLGVTNVPTVLSTLAELDWEPRRVASSLFMMSTPGMAWGASSGPDAFEGWTGVDQVHADNGVLTHWLDRFEVENGRRPRHTFFAIGIDLGNSIVEAIAQAPRKDPEGLRTGLERVRRLPAAVGGPGTVISFHQYEHRGYQGDYIVLRSVRDGQFVDVAPAPL